MTAVEPLQDAAEVRIAACGNVFFTDLRGRTTLDTVHTIGHAVGGHARVLRRPYALLQLLRESSPPPEGAVRQALIDITTAGKGPLQAFVTVALGPPLRQSIARSVMANFALAAPPGLLVEVTQDVVEACRIVAQHSGEMDADTLQEAFSAWADL